VLQIAVPGYRCLSAECGRAVFNEDLGKLAAPRAGTTRRCVRYVLRRWMIDRTTSSAIAAELGASWHTVNTIAMRVVADLITAAGPDRLAGVRVIGVDEHRWAPRRVGAPGFVTLIIDLTAVHDHSGPARLLAMVEGRSATALASWLAARPDGFAQCVEIIAMDGFAGYTTSASSVVSDAVTVMDPFMPTSGLCRCRVGWGWSRRPLVGPNSGFDAWQKLGVQQYFGRDENIAGRPAGSRSAIGLLVLRLTLPGIPDHYKGHELPYFAFVDHDTRHPVDWLGGPDDARVDRRRDPEAARDPPGACPPRPTP